MRCALTAALVALSALPLATLPSPVIAQAATVVAIAYGIVGAAVLIALLAKVGLGPVVTFMGESVAASWRWLGKLAGLET